MNHGAALQSVHHCGCGSFMTHPVNSAVENTVQLPANLSGMLLAWRLIQTLSKNMFS